LNSIENIDYNISNNVANENSKKRVQKKNGKDVQYQLKLTKEQNKENVKPKAL
jgi:hypothetical protein